MTPSATLVDVTVDDLYPDPRTRQSIIFDNGNWNIGQHCQQCAFQLDPFQTYRGSWHDITFDPTDSDFNSTATATFSFTGSALSLYGILSQRTASHVQYFIDDQPHGTFSHEPEGKDAFVYNVTLFSVDSLPYGPHVFMVKNGEVGEGHSSLLLDYLVYTTQEKTPSNTTAGRFVTETVTEIPAVGVSKTSAFGLAIVFGTLWGLTVVLVLWSHIRRLRNGIARVHERTPTPNVARNSSFAVSVTTTTPSSQTRHFSSTDATAISNMCVVQADICSESLESRDEIRGTTRRMEKLHALIYGDHRGDTCSRSAHMDLHPPTTAGQIADARVCLDGLGERKSTFDKNCDQYYESLF